MGEGAGVLLLEELDHAKVRSFYCDLQPQDIHMPRVCTQGSHGLVVHMISLMGSQVI